MLTGDIRLGSECSERSSMKNKILLIDDDSAAREALVAALQNEYQVFSAEDKQRAIEYHGAEHVELLVFSINRAENLRAAAIKWLSRIDHRLPVILLTENSSPRTPIEETSSDACLQKPVEVGLLLQKIRELIDESAQARDARVMAHRALDKPFAELDNAHYCDVLRTRTNTPYFCDRANYNDSMLPNTPALPGTEIPKATS